MKTIRLNVYEYTIKDSKLGKYKGSYTIPAGVPTEKEQQKKYHSKLVQSFDYTIRQTKYQPKKEFKIYKLSDNTVI